MIKATEILLLGLLFTSVYAAGCTYSAAPGNYSGGCVQNCKDFANLELAQAACNSDPACNAVTFSQPQSGGSGATGAVGNGWGYQLRASVGTSVSPSGESTWVKSCPPFICDFQPYTGTYLGGCFNNCIDYPTLAAAENACRQSSGCGGVTFSKKAIGGSSATNAYNGAWGYQLRSGNSPTGSPNGEDSWLKINCNNYSQATDCYVPAPGAYSGGCSQNCKDFGSLSDAKSACNGDSSCKGITFSQPQSGGGASRGAVGNGWGYQLRASTNTAGSPSGETTWVKTDCSSLFPCDYQSSQGYYLGGCFNNCQDYSTLAAAQAACRQNAGCGGVTFSKRSIGGSSATNAYDGSWGYQLRSGSTLILSPNGEDSWKKQSCGSYSVVVDQCLYSYSAGNYSGGCSQNCKDFSNIEDAKRACNADSSCNAVTFSMARVGGSSSTGASGGGWGYQLRASASGTASPNQENTWIKSSCQPAVNPPCFFQQFLGTYLGGCYNGCKDYSNLNDAQNACKSGGNSCGGVTFSRANVGGPNATNAFNKFWGYQLRSGSNPTLSPNGEDSWKQTCLNYPALFTGCNYTGDRLDFSPGNNPSFDLSQYHSLYVPSGGSITLSQGGKTTVYKASVACMVPGFVSFIEQVNFVSSSKPSLEKKLKKQH